MTQPLGSVMLDVEGHTLTSDERELLARPAVGGVILFARTVFLPSRCWRCAVRSAASIHICRSPSIRKADGCNGCAKA